MTAPRVLLAAALLLVPALGDGEMPAAVEQRCPCHGPQPGKSWGQHGEYVFCVGATAGELVRQGVLEPRAARDLMQSASDSQCGSRRASGPCGGPRGASCEPGFVCNIVDPTCRGGDLPGRCAAVSALCPPAKDPVCGCDGLTYASDCERLHAGAILARRGPCAEKCGGPEAKSCGAGKVCVFPTGSCGEDERAGQCAALPKPCACSQRYEPVCACDGQDYANPCAARCAGVSIRKRGKCPTG